MYGKRPSCESIYCGIGHIPGYVCYTSYSQLTSLPSSPLLSSQGSVHNQNHQGRRKLYSLSDMGHSRTGEGEPSLPVIKGLSLVFMLDGLRAIWRTTKQRVFQVAMAPREYNVMHARLPVFVYSVWKTTKGWLQIGHVWQLALFPS